MQLSSSGRCLEDDRSVVIQQAASLLELVEVDPESVSVLRPVAQHRPFGIESRLAAEDDITYGGGFMAFFGSEHLSNQLDNPMGTLLVAKVDLNVRTSDSPARRSILAKMKDRHRQGPYKGWAGRCIPSSQKTRLFTG
jgi:hypothetical protein